MSEVTKLYENANVRKHWNSTPYGGVEEHYPPFTAEKQIAILQLLTQQCDLTISHFTEWEFIHYDGQEPLEITGKDFTETFAKLKLLPKYKKGTHLNLKQVSIFKTKEIKIVSTRNFPVSADGEMYYMNRIHMKVLPKALNIVHIN